MIHLCPQYCVRRKPHLSKRHRCSLNAPHTRNYHSGFVKIQQLIHKEIRCFILVRRKLMWHIKNAVVFYYEAKIIMEMREKLPTRGGVYILRTFQRAINRPKTYPQLFYFSNLFINGQAFSISGKIQIFSILCKGVQGKRHTNYYQSAVLLCWYAQTIMKLKHIWIRGVNY